MRAAGRLDGLIGWTAARNRSPCRPRDARAGSYEHDRARADASRDRERVGRRDEVRRLVRRTCRRRWPTRRNKRFGIPPAEIQWFGEDSVSKKPFFRGQSTKVNIERAMSQLARECGRGRPDRPRADRPRQRRGRRIRRSAFRVPTSARRDFAQMLAQFTTQKVAFIDLTSASGDMLPVVSRAESRRHHGDEERLRAKRVALRAVLRRRADQGRRRHRQGRPRLAARGVPIRGRRDEAFVRDRHAAPDGTRAARRRRREDRRERSGRPHGAGPARAAVLPRRRDQHDGRERPAARRRSTRTSSRSRIRSTNCASKKPTMTADAYDDALEVLLVQLARKSKSIREMEGRKSG